MPPICSLENCSSQEQEQYTYPSSPSSDFRERHCQKACFTSMEQEMIPSSGPHSLAAAAMSLMAVEISEALLPSWKTIVWMHSQLLSLLSMLLISISSKIVRHQQYHFASTLCTQIPLACPSSLSITFFFGISTMMFLSQVSMSFFVLTFVFHPKSFFDFLQSFPGYGFKTSAEMPSTPTALPFENEARLCMITDIVSLGA